MKMTNTKNKNQAKETPRRTLRLEARVTKEEYAKAAELAQSGIFHLHIIANRIDMEEGTETINNIFLILTLEYGHRKVKGISINRC